MSNLSGKGSFGKLKTSERPGFIVSVYERHLKNDTTQDRSPGLSDTYFQDKQDEPKSPKDQKI